VPIWLLLPLLLLLLLLPLLLPLLLQGALSGCTTCWRSSLTQSSRSTLLSSSEQACLTDNMMQLLHALQVIMPVSADVHAAFFMI
jgi:hypothetical protein